MQEINTILAFVFLAFVWYKWMNYLAECRENATLQEDHLSTDWREHLTLTFAHWQAASVVLAIGFIFFSSGYWDLIITKTSTDTFWRRSLSTPFWVYPGY